MAALTTVLLGLFTASIFASLKFAVTNRPLSSKMLRALLLARRKPMRVSIAALLRICRNDTYILFRMSLRREAFGPPGGVIKYFQAASDDLHGMDFTAERVPNEPYSHNTVDLRGVLPSRNILRFRRWLQKGKDRETAEQCLRREIVEEVHELSVGSGMPLFSAVTFHHVRTVEDGPKSVPEDHRWQFRTFEILEIRDDTRANQAFCDWLFDFAINSPNVISCSAEDIRKGRSMAGHTIGSHAQALLGRKISRPDQPLFRA